MHRILCVFGCVVFTVGCASAGVSQPEEQAAEAKTPVLSACGVEVLRESTRAYTNCFSGNEQFAACETCGYYGSEAQAQGARDCITCPDGYELDVWYTDCTGECVPKGQATRPQVAKTCRPVTACVEGFLTEGSRPPSAE